MSTCKIKRIGPINIKIENEFVDKYTFFEENFQGIDITEEIDDIDIIIKICKDCYEFKEQYYSSSIKLSDNGYMKENTYFKYSVNNLLGDQVVICIYPKQNSKNLKWYIKNIVNLIRGIKLNELIMDTFFSYQIFWGIFAIALLKKDMAFIHCGCIDFNGDGIMFVGTGGCGKTSTSFKLLEDKRYKYVTEDFGIIDKNGNAYFNPKHMAIYESDIKHGQKDLVNYKKSIMNKYKKFTWNISEKLGRNPRIKVSPKLVLGNSRITNVTKLKDVYFFARKKCDNIEQCNISKEEFIERALNAAFRELTPIHEILSHPRSVIGKNESFIKFEELKQRYREIYKMCFEKIDVKLYYLPKNVNPKETLVRLRYIEGEKNE